mgnify:CR=1 FL=1
MSRDPFAYRLRDGSAYRADRLEEERIRIERRLLWAERRGDRQAVQWLESRLVELEEAIEADLRPGRQPGRLG